MQKANNYGAGRYLQMETCHVAAVFEEFHGYDYR